MSTSDLPSSIPGTSLARQSKEMNKRGFKRLVSMDAARHEIVLAAVSSSLDPEAPPVDVQAFATQIGLSRIEATEILVAASSAVLSMVAPPPQTPEEFSDFAVNQAVLDEADKPKLLDFARLIDRQRSRYARYVEQGRLASSVLPQLTDVKTAVELRFAFDKENRVRTAVAVLTVHLDTDTKEEIWFQLGIGQVEKLIRDLQTARDRMKGVHEWYSKQPEGHK